MEIAEDMAAQNALMAHYGMTETRKPFDFNKLQRRVSSQQQSQAGSV